MLRIFLLTTLFIASGGYLAAQQDMVKTEILTVALGKSFGDLFFKPGEEVRPLGANVGALSQPMAYVGPPVLIIHDQESDFAPVDEGEEPPKPVAVVKLPERANRVLFVCQQPKEGEVNVRAYDISTGGQKAGDYRFFNFANFSVGVIMGKNKFVLPSGKERLVSESSWRSEVLDIPVQFGTLVEGKEKLVYSSMWGHRPAKRNMVFLFGSSDRNRPIAIGRFYDYPGQSAPPAKE